MNKTKDSSMDDTNCFVAYNKIVNRNNEYSMRVDTIKENGTVKVVNISGVAIWLEFPSVAKLLYKS